MERSSKNLIKFLVINVLFTVVILTLAIFMRNLLEVVVGESGGFTKYFTLISLLMGIVAMGGIFIGALLDRPNKRKTISIFFGITIVYQFTWVIMSRVIEMGGIIQLVMAIVSLILISIVLQTTSDMLPPIIADKKFLYFNIFSCIFAVLVAALVAGVKLPGLISEYLREISLVSVVIIFMLILSSIKNLKVDSKEAASTKGIFGSISEAFKTVRSDRILIQGFINIMYGTIMGSVVIRVSMSYYFMNNNDMSNFGRVRIIESVMTMGVIVFILYRNRKIESKRILDKFIVAIPLCAIVLSFSELLSTSTRTTVLSIVVLGIVGYMRVIKIHILTYINENYPKGIQGRLIATLNVVQNMVAVIIISLNFILKITHINIDDSWKCGLGGVFIIAVLLGISKKFSKEKVLER